MSYTITNNIMYVRDDAGNLVPVSMIASGADRTIQAIRDTAAAAEAQIDTRVSAANAAIEAKADEQAARIPEVTALAGDVAQLKDGVATGEGIMAIRHGFFPDVYKSIDSSFGEYAFKYDADEATYTASRRKTAAYTGIFGVNNIDAGIQPETGCVDLTAYPYAWFHVDTNMPDAANPRIRIYFYNSGLIPDGAFQVYDYPIFNGAHFVDFRALIAEKGWDAKYYDRAFLRNVTSDSFEFTAAPYISIVQRGYITENEFRNLNLKKLLETMDERIGAFDERIDANRSAIDGYYPNEAFMHPLRDVLHRCCGENQIAPENTIAGCKWAAQNGWHFIETDVDWTSDGVAVLLHDTTINRTARNADGTEISGDVTLNDITYQQALEYDFGIYKGSEYAGEKIPTFEQFIVACRNYNLHPYIELKERNADEQKIQSLVDVVFEYGMERNVTWTSFSRHALRYVRAYDVNARLVLIASDQYLSYAIDWAIPLKSRHGRVGICLLIDVITDDFVNQCKENGFQLGTYCPNTTEKMATVHPYVSEVTSDKLKYSAYLLNS